MIVKLEVKSNDGAVETIEYPFKYLNGFVTDGHATVIFSNRVGDVVGDGSSVEFSGYTIYRGKLLYSEKLGDPDERSRLVGTSVGFMVVA